MATKTKKAASKPREQFNFSLNPNKPEDLQVLEKLKKLGDATGLDRSNLIYMIVHQNLAAFARKYRV